MDFMKELIIDDENYVVVPKKDYQALQKTAALKWKPEKPFSIEEARALSKKRIDEWASGK